MTNDLPPIDLLVEIPGGLHARYDYDFRQAALRLAQVVYPDERAPADRRSVARTLTNDGPPLAALLLGTTSRAAGCRGWARPIAALTVREGEDSRLALIAVAEHDPHFADIARLADLSPERRHNLKLFLYWNGARMKWPGAEAAQRIVCEAHQAFRLAQAQSCDARPLQSAWQPLTAQSGAANESQRHTAAKYAQQSLPFCFQRYAEEYLAPDEHVLAAVSRPAMHGARASRWRARPRLEEGILAVADQQVSQVVELLPPDSASIRFGFAARATPPERLTGARLAARPAGWLSREGDRRLRRAEPPCPPQHFPSFVPHIGQVERIRITFPMTGAGFRERYFMLRRPLTLTGEPDADRCAKGRGRRRRHPRKHRAGDRRPGAHSGIADGGAAGRGPRADRGCAGHRQDQTGQGPGSLAGLLVSAHPVHP